MADWLRDILSLLPQDLRIGVGELVLAQLAAACDVETVQRLVLAGAQFLNDQLPETADNVECGG